MNPLKELDHLLGSDMQALIEPIPGAGEVVLRELQANNLRFKQWLSRHNRENAHEVREFFATYITRVESELSIGHASGELTHAEGMSAAVEDFRKTSTRGPKLGLFLMEDAARSLLLQQPPENLMRGTDSKDLAALFAKISPIQCLALTRHTESNEWQERYLNELAMLTSDRFEEREVRYFIVDVRIYARALQSAGRPLKPWRMSHSKEAGVITCFTHEEVDSLRTPRLILAALLFHYTEEILRAARALRHLPRRTSGPGQYISAIIRSTQRKLPYFSPNTHSEALYWENALAELDAAHPSLGIKEYIPLLTCGGFLDDTDHPVSLNLIDHLWNVNFNEKNPGYFKFPTKDFVYHFREALWSEVLRRLRKLTSDEMSHAVFHALDIDDVELTRMMLEKAGSTPSFKSRVTRLFVSLGRPVARLLRRSRHIDT